MQQQADGGALGLDGQETGDWMEDDVGEQPPAASMVGAGSSPAGQALAGLGSRQRPEEEEFARVLGAGAGRGACLGRWEHCLGTPSMPSNTAACSACVSCGIACALP